MRRPTLHLGNDPPAGKPQARFWSISVSLRVHLPWRLLPYRNFLSPPNNRCPYHDGEFVRPPLSPSPPVGSAYFLRPPKKIGPNLGKPPPERSGGLHNAPTVTLPACFFASTARRYLLSPAYFAYALDGSFDKISPMCSMEVPACHAPSEVDGQAKYWKPSM